MEKVKLTTLAAAEVDIDFDSVPVDSCRSTETFAIITLTASRHICIRMFICRRLGGGKLTEEYRSRGRYRRGWSCDHNRSYRLDLN